MGPLGNQFWVALQNTITDRSKAVLLLWIFYVFVLSCVCYVFLCVCLFVLCGYLQCKDWPLRSRLWCLTVSLSLSHLYPGSGVVLDCIDSWSLHPYLLWFTLVSNHDGCIIVRIQMHISFWLSSETLWYDPFIYALQLNGYNMFSSDFCRLLITFANSLDLNRLTVCQIVFLNDFLKRLYFKNKVSSRQQRHEKMASMQRNNGNSDILNETSKPPVNTTHFSVYLIYY